jgi:hypothetical protein
LSEESGRDPTHKIQTAHGVVDCFLGCVVSGMSVCYMRLSFYLNKKPCPGKGSLEPIIHNRFAHLCQKLNNSYF